MAPRGPRMVLRWPRDGSKMQDTPEMPPNIADDAFKLAQMAEDGPQMAPEWLQDGQAWPHDGPNMVQDGHNT